MKLTPIDVQQQQFRREFRGFERREVESFLELIGQQIGDLVRENTDLRADVRRVDRELEDHQEREATLKQAMLTAQRAIDEIREQAEREAKLMLTEAELRAEKLVFDAHRRVGKVLDDIQDLRRQRVRAIAELRGIVETHVKLLDVHEEANAEEEQPEANVMVLDHIRPPAPPDAGEFGHGRANQG